MKSILYIGNFLSAHGKAPAPNEVICRALSNHFGLKKCSGIHSPIFRLIHMLTCAFKGRFQGYSVLLVDVFSSKAFWYAYMVSTIGRFLNMPIILVLHGGNLPARYEKSKKASERMFFNANAIISPSNYLKEHTESVFAVQVKVIPNPIELSAYPLLQKDYKVAQLLWVRSFHNLYNPMMAVEVCEFLTQFYPNVTLNMIGPDKDGSMQEVKKRAKDKGLSDQIQTPGLMSKEDWVKASRNCNVFINTTHFDNTPVSVIEALALGLPVVSTNVGGIPYLLEHEETALLVEDGDHEAMAEAVLRIMKDSDLREKLIRQGRALAEQMDLERIAEEWKTLIHEVVS